MKKIFFIILSCVVLVSTLIVPAFAEFPSSYLDNSNLLDEYDTINASFNNGGLQPLYYVDLEPSTTYTFVAPSGSDRFLASPVVENYPGMTFPTVYSYNSPNWYMGNTLSGSSGAQSYELIFIFRVNEMGTYYFNFDYSVSNSTLLYCYGSNDLGDFYPANQSVNGSGHISWEIDVDRLGSSGASNIYLMLVPSVNINYSFSNVYFSNEPTGQYVPGWASPSYTDGYIQTYTFTTDANGGGTWAIGFSDSMIGNNEGFSREQAENSKFYLVEGDLDLDSFYEYYYTNGYDSGYDEGYKIGEYDGLSSSSMLRSIIFTIFSAPFAIVSNVLDFELLGINIYNLVKVSITILLISWVITRLKGRE